MRWAFVSDIHGNLPAWNTVLSDCAVRGVNRIVCLGDTVGYGPQPAECLRSVWSHSHVMALGNHDAVVGGRLSADVFNDRARRSAEWTRARLGDAAVALFAKLPVVLRGPGWRAAHGGLSDPAAFPYVFSEEDAAASFAAAPEQLLLCGHTHEAALFVVGESGRVHKTEPQDFALEPGKRYLVNVGSAGSPRDGDPRASYVIWDDVERAIFHIRAPFDFSAFRMAVAQADGLDPQLVPLLRAAAVGSEPDAVREAPDFSAASGQRVEGGATVASVEAELRRDNARLRGRYRLALGAAAAAVAAAAGIYFATKTHDAHFPPRSTTPILLDETGGADGNLLPPLNPSRTGRFSCEPYGADLADARHQSVMADEDWHVAISSQDSSCEARFFAPSLETAPGARIEALARARFSGDFKGSFQLVIVAENEDGTEKELLLRNFSTTSTGIAEEALPTSIRALRASEGWRLARATTDPIPATTRQARIELRGAFSGTVTIGAMAARRKAPSK